MPSAKATSASGLAKSVSPVSWLTILAVTVVIASNGLSDKLGRGPCPQHHDHRLADGAQAASRIAPTMPGRAAGRTTWRMVSDWVAPSP